MGPQCTSDKFSRQIFPVGALWVEHLIKAVVIRGHRVYADRGCPLQRKTTVIRLYSFVEPRLYRLQSLFEKKAE